MNILRAGDKTPMQREKNKNVASDLLAALRFLGRPYNFCNFVIIFSLIKSQRYVKVVTYFTDSEMIKYYQKPCG